jgi:hypothetical protein
MEATKCPWADNRIKNTRYIHTMDCYIALKRIPVMFHYMDKP